MNTKNEARSTAKKTVESAPANDATSTVTSESMIVPAGKETARKEDWVFDDDDFYANAPCTD